MKIEETNLDNKELEVDICIFYILYEKTNEFVNMEFLLPKKLRKRVVSPAIRSPNRTNLQNSKNENTILYNIVWYRDFWFYPTNEDTIHYLNILYLLNRFFNDSH